MLDPPPSTRRLAPVPGLTASALRFSVASIRNPFDPAPTSRWGGGHAGRRPMSVIVAARACREPVRVYSSLSAGRLMTPSGSTMYSISRSSSSSSSLGGGGGGGSSAGMWAVL
jgi:hypothetical protein